MAVRLARRPYVPTEQEIAKAAVTPRERAYALRVADALDEMKGFDRDHFARVYETKGEAAAFDLIPREAFERAMFAASDRYFSAALTETGSAEAGMLGASFDATNWRVFNIINEQTGDLIVQINQSQRRAVQNVVARSQMYGIAPRDMADIIGNSVGLHDRWAVAVMNYDRGLVEQGVSYAERQRLVGAYHDKLLRARSMNIARTETIRATEMGRYVAWEEAAAAQLFDKKTALKEWSAAFGACPICGNLSGEQVPWDGQFSDGSLMPPAHPSCRCSAFLVPGSGKRSIEERALDDLGTAQEASGFGLLGRTAVGTGLLTAFIASPVDDILIGWGAMAISRYVAPYVMRMPWLRGTLPEGMPGGGEVIPFPINEGQFVDTIYQEFRSEESAARYLKRLYGEAGMANARRQVPKLERVALDAYRRHDGLLSDVMENGTAAYEGQIYHLADFQEQIRALDSLLSRSPRLVQPTRVFRIEEMTDDLARRFEVGNIFQDSTYNATIASRDTVERLLADAFREGRRNLAVVEYRLPVGEKATWLKGMIRTEVELAREGRNFEELLIPRDLEFRVARNYIDDDGTRRVILDVMGMEQVPVNPIAVDGPKIWGQPFGLPKSVDEMFTAVNEFAERIAPDWYRGRGWTVHDILPEDLLGEGLRGPNVTGLPRVNAIARWADSRHGPSTIGVTQDLMDRIAGFIETATNNPEVFTTSPEVFLDGAGALKTLLHEATHMIAPARSNVQAAGALALEEASSEIIARNLMRPFMDFIGVPNAAELPWQMVDEFKTVYRTWMDGFLALAERAEAGNAETVLWRWTRTVGDYPGRLQKISDELVTSLGVNPVDDLTADALARVQTLVDLHLRNIETLRYQPDVPWEQFTDELMREIEEVVHPLRPPPVPPPAGGGALPAAVGEPAETWVPRVIEGGQAAAPETPTAPWRMMSREPDAAPYPAEPNQQWWRRSLFEEEDEIFDPVEWEHRWTVADPAVAAPPEWLTEGVREYERRHGFPDLGVDYLKVMQDRERSKAIAAAYDAMPSYDEKAADVYRLMARETEEQFKFLTDELGVTVEVVSEDPYPTINEMIDDLYRNRRIKVLSTESTGGHPVFTNEQNDMFRAVHDVFGHANTGRAFDRHGEEAAWLAHAQMFSPEARAAMTTETRGQNASLIWNHTFAEQKIGLLPDEMSALPEIVEGIEASPTAAPWQQLAERPVNRNLFDMPFTPEGPKPGVEADATIPRSTQPRRGEPGELPSAEDALMPIGEEARPGFEAAPFEEAMPVYREPLPSRTKWWWRVGENEYTELTFDPTGTGRPPSMAGTRGSGVASGQYSYGAGANTRGQFIEGAREVMGAARPLQIKLPELPETLMDTSTHLMRLAEGTETDELIVQRVKRQLRAIVLDKPIDQINAAVDRAVEVWRVHQQVHPMNIVLSELGYDGIEYTGAASDFARAGRWGNVKFPPITREGQLAGVVDSGSGIGVQLQPEVMIERLRPAPGESFPGIEELRERVGSLLTRPTESALPLPVETREIEQALMQTPARPLLEAAKGLDTLSQKTGVEPWRDYLRSYNQWIEELRAAEREQAAGVVRLRPGRSLIENDPPPLPEIPGTRAPTQGVTFREVDPDDAFDYVRSQFGPPVPNNTEFPPPWRQAAADYVREGSRAINEPLRSGIAAEELPEVVRERVQTLDQVFQVMKKQPVGSITDPVVVYRGQSFSRFPTVDSLEDLVGREYLDRGFVSTSVNKEHAISFAEQHVEELGDSPLNNVPVLVELHLPEGQPALHVFGNLEEILLPRNTIFRIKSVKRGMIEVGGRPWKSFVEGRADEWVTVVVEPVGQAPETAARNFGERQLFDEIPAETERIAAERAYTEMLQAADKLDDLSRGNDDALDLIRNYVQANERYVAAQREMEAARLDIEHLPIDPEGRPIIPDDYPWPPQVQRAHLPQMPEPFEPEPNDVLDLLADVRRKAQALPEPTLGNSSGLRAVLAEGPPGEIVLEGIDPSARKLMIHALDRFADEFPEAARMIRYFGTGPTTNGTALMTTTRAGRITINATKFADLQKTLGDWWTYTERIRGAVPAWVGPEDAIEYFTFQEMGHVLHNFLDEGKALKMTRWLKNEYIPAWMPEGWSWSDGPSLYRMIRMNLSGYAAEAGGHFLAETVAESLAEFMIATGKSQQARLFARGIVAYAEGLVDAVRGGLAQTPSLTRRLMSTLDFEGGFSIVPATGEDVPLEGWAVSRPRAEGYEERFSMIGMTDEAVAQRVIEYQLRNREVLAIEGNYFGGWRDPETGYYYLDVANVMHSKEAAIVAGLLGEQEAIYNMKTLDYVRLRPPEEVTDPLVLKLRKKLGLSE